MRYDTISSGSKGNATLVFSDDSVILLDFGISKKRVSAALRNYGLGFDSLLACFLTHDHSDHASHIADIEKDKLYASNVTLPHIEYMLDKNHLLVPFVPVFVGPFKVTPFPLFHDAKNTVGFLVEDSKESLVYLTDTGFVPEKDYDLIRDKTYYLFESNHDPQMLFNSKRPDYLVRRIISDKGHLSNADAAYYLAVLIGSHTKEVVLSHLSDECNTPELAIKTFQDVVLTQLGYIPDVILKTASDKRETKGGEK